MASPTVSTGRALAGGLAALRIFWGLVFLSNAFAKLIDVSDYQIGPFAVNLISRSSTHGILETAVKDTWIPPLGALYQNVVLANWDFFIVALTAAEFAIGLGLLFGVASRLAALGALLLIGPIWLMTLDQGQYLWEYPAELVPFAILAIVPAGRTAGLDRPLAARFGGRWPF